MDSPLHLRVDATGDAIRLRSPGVGWFTGAAREGEVLSPGRCAGHLVVLGRAFPLVIPEGVAGIVRSRPSDLVHAPVGYGDVLYELASLESAAGIPLAGARAQRDDAASGGALVYRSSDTGRFWHRSSPAEPPLVAAGATIESGAAIGLLEVMKTFTQVAYRPSGSLPERARVVRVLASDGADVRQGEPLLELEPA